MKWADLRLRLHALLFRKRVEQDLQDELEFHLEMHNRKNRGLGMDVTDAKRRAVRKFGNIQKVAEECRDERRLNLIDSAIQDARYAFRQFRRSPLWPIRFPFA